MSKSNSILILGGGVTGIAAGMACGLPVYEAAAHPGGICSSYYIRPNSSEKLHAAPQDGEAYRFEIGGGHWIFGGEPTVLEFIERLAPVRRYSRKSSVYFADERKYVPYPLQNHLRFLGPDVAATALQEMAAGAVGAAKFATMDEWLLSYFGKTLCEKFFIGFHQLYTAGLSSRIAPQDAYKSPVNLAQAIEGAFREPASVGYNVTFVYPEDGLDALTQRMARQCDMRYGKRAVRIDCEAKRVSFADGSEAEYDTLLCTLPLNKALETAGLSLEETPDPHSSVLVLNIGGLKGKACPDDHWLYHPATRSGFHRVGFYSNVDRSFLPRSSRDNGDRVSIYVERAYPGGQRPSEKESRLYANATVQELTDWGFLRAAEVVDPTWIDVAYTWSLPNSSWKRNAQKLLQDRGIFMVGRYARWNFQGIADSIKDGFWAGSCLRPKRL